jgi:hypothetical protein
MTITSSKTGDKPTRHAPLVAPRSWLALSWVHWPIWKLCNFAILHDIVCDHSNVVRTRDRGQNRRGQRVKVASHGSWKARRWPTSVRPPRAFCGPVLLGQLSNPHQLGVSKLSLESQHTQCGAKAADIAMCSAPIMGCMATMQSVRVLAHATPTAHHIHCMRQTFTECKSILLYVDQDQVLSFDPPIKRMLRMQHLPDD